MEKYTTKDWLTTGQRLAHQVKRLDKVGRPNDKSIWTDLWPIILPALGTSRQLALRTLNGFEFLCHLSTLLNTAIAGQSLPGSVRLRRRAALVTIAVLSSCNDCKNGQLTFRHSTDACWPNLSDRVTS